MRLVVRAKPRSHVASELLCALRSYGVRLYSAQKNLRFLEPAVSTSSRPPVSTRRLMHFAELADRALVNMFRSELGDLDVDAVSISVDSVSGRVAWFRRATNQHYLPTWEEVFDSGR